jgi:hypothetical protein
MMSRAILVLTNRVPDSNALSKIKVIMVLLRRASAGLFFALGRYYYLFCIRLPVLGYIAM